MDDFQNPNDSDPTPPRAPQPHVAPQQQAPPAPGAPAPIDQSAAQQQPSPNYGGQPAQPPNYQAPPAQQFGQQPPAYGQQPPAYGQQPPAYGAAAPGYGQPAAGFGPAPFSDSTVKGPRPRVPVGAILMIAGAVIAILATLLPWASFDNESLNGYDDFVLFSDDGLQRLSNPAVFNVIGAVIMLGLGIATLAAGRVLAVTIIGIVSGVLGILGGLIVLVLIADFTDSFGLSLGIGVILQPIAPIVSLAGAIIATAKRRKAVAPAPY